MHPGCGADGHAAASAAAGTQRSGPFFPLFIASFLLLVLVMTNPPLFAQAPPPPNSDGELVFYRDDNLYHHAVDITFKLKGVLFNDIGVYDLEVDLQHPDVTYFSAGSSLMGSAIPITLPTPGFNPSQITWESAAPDDSKPSNAAYGSSSEYCPGMIGWGLYEVLVSSVHGSLVFYINSLDGNWLDQAYAGSQDIFIRVRQPFNGPPECHVYEWNTSTWVAISNNSTLSSWDISSTGRGRDVLERAWDYSQGAICPSPFVLGHATNYPLYDPSAGITIDYAKLDVHSELHASFMTVPVGKVFEIADWIDDQLQSYTTIITVLENNTVKVEGELRLRGHRIGDDVFAVTLRGESDQRGFWTGIKTNPNAIVSVRYAHILHAVRGVDLRDGAFLDAYMMEIAEFEEYGVMQIDARALVRDSRIHSGSIGVYATGACQGTYYGWKDQETTYHVRVYNCDGHGFELVDLEAEQHGGIFVDQQMTFTIQFSDIFANQLYGIWIRGTSSPLLNENRIYNNGLYGGQTPSHDGVHVNGGGFVSLHHNIVSGNAYGLHHNDAGYVRGYVHQWPPFTQPDIFVKDPLLGFNCFIQNTINLGCNRGAESIFGLGPNGEYEPYDGSPMKYGGSNSFVDPTSGYQASNGSGYVYAEHNCWLPTFNVTGYIYTGGDFADCDNHYLPECTEPPGPGGMRSLESFSNGLVPTMILLESYVATGNWQALKSEALNLLSTSTNDNEISRAANLLARIRGITNDPTIETTLRSYVASRFSGTVSVSVKHAVYTALLFIKLLEKNHIEALQLCALIEQECSGTELAKTGELFKAMILGEQPGTHAQGVRVAQEMWKRDQGDSEALALYYSLTHCYPVAVPKRYTELAAKDITLYQNYPNPFNPTTAITFSVPESMPVRLVVRDITGRVVETLLDRVVDAGITSVIFDGRSLNTGLYICVLETPKGILTKRMILVK
jgi:hypothetical protein